MASWELAEKKTTWGKLILVLIGEANLMNIYVLIKLPQPLQNVIYTSKAIMMKLNSSKKEKLTKIHKKEKQILNWKTAKMKQIVLSQ